MTAKDLETTLLALGCPEFGEEEFVYIVNTALRKLFNDCEIIAQGKIFAHGITPTAVREEVYHPAGERLSYPLVGKAFSVKLCGGTPEVVIGTGTGATTHLLKDGVTLLKGFLENNAGIISFCGDYDYVAYDICQYDAIVSDQREQIPDGSDYTFYDVTNFIANFRSFESMPTDILGNPIEGAVAVGKKIRVNAGYKGDIYFNYRAGPSQVVYFNSDTIINIPKEYEMLLVPLFMTIYFVNIDIDRSNECKELYLSLLEGLPKHKEFSFEPTADRAMTAEYLIKDGWA